jgi:hypothetical protein
LGKYKKINDYTKVKLFYCQPNRYNIDAIAFEETFPQELLTEIQPNMDEMFDKTIIPLIMRLYDEAGVEMPDVNNPTYDINDII